MCEVPHNHIQTQTCTDVEYAFSAAIAPEHSDENREQFY